jgi:hypothetical protein
MHIRAASMFAREAFATEANLPTSRDEYHIYNLSAIVESYFFLEGTANYFFSMASDSSKSALSNHTTNIRETLDLIWQNGLIQRTNTLEKYKLLLKVCNLQSMQNNRTLQAVKTLQEFRNYLVHYKLEGITVGAAPVGLEAKLQSELITSHPELNHTFPYNFLSHGCAEWAITSALNFVDQFCIAINQTPHYDRTSLPTR